MPTGRLRSQSTSSPNYSSSTPSSPLLSRGFASLRRSHRHTASATENRQSIAVMPPPPSTSVSTPRTNGGDDIIQEHRIRLVPNVGTTTRCFVFDVIERSLHSGVVLKLGRYSDRNSCADRLSFKSKVVSRCHAELWQEDGKIYIKDSGSSSGTFVNRARLGPANTSSRPFVIQDGDLIQLGVDYKGGVQPMYRAVRIRFEVDRTPTLQQTAFSRVAFRQLKHCLRTSLAPGSGNNHPSSSSSALAQTTDERKLPSLSPEEPSSSQAHPTSLSPSSSTSSASSIGSSSSSVEVQECCICLYSMGPGQALFITPCSHIYHYRCLRPILTQNFPGFSCPLCRTYSDLDVMVATEKEDMEHMLQLDHSNTNSNRKKGRKKTKALHGGGNTRSRHQGLPIAEEEEATTAPAAIEESGLETSSSLAPGINGVRTAAPVPVPVPAAQMIYPVGTDAQDSPSSFSPGFEDMVTSDTDMELGSSTRPSPSSDDDEHNPGTTTTDGSHIGQRPILRQHKSAGPDGLLATTLVGSPCPFELMIHQETSAARLTPTSTSMHTEDSSPPHT